MHPGRRKCLMRDEISIPGMYPMKMFKEFKKSSCQLECKAQYLIEKYGCLPYYMPSLPGHFIKKFKPDFKKKIQRSSSSTKKDSILCSLSKLREMEKEITKMSALNPNSSTTTKSFIDGLSCSSCPDECESTVYKFQVSYAEFEDNENLFYNNLFSKKCKRFPAVNEHLFKEYEKYVKAIFSNIEEYVEVKGPPLKTKETRPHRKSCLETTVKNKIGKMSYVHIYFDSFGVTKYLRNEVYGWQDLIAFFGGIVGLCVGFSLLSGAELIYFFTIRLFFWKKRKQAKTQDLEEELKKIQKQHYWENAFSTFEIQNMK